MDAVPSWCLGLLHPFAIHPNTCKMGGRHRASGRQMAHSRPAVVVVVVRHASMPATLSLFGAQPRPKPVASLFTAFTPVKAASARARFASDLTKARTSDIISCHFISLSFPRRSPPHIIPGMFSRAARARVPSSILRSPRLTQQAFAKPRVSDSLGGV